MNFWASKVGWFLLLYSQKRKGGREEGKEQGTTETMKATVRLNSLCSGAERKMTA